MIGANYAYPQASSRSYNLPATIPDLGLWLKGDAGITLVSGAVDVWADQSGNGRDYSAPGASNRPGLTTLNGLPVLTLDGTDDYLLGNAASLNLAQAVSGITMIAVVKYASASIQRVFGLSDSTGATNTRTLLGVSATQWQTGGRRLDADGVVVLSGGTANANFVVQVGILRYSVATGAVFVNGASQVDTAFQTAGNTSNTASQRSVIGCGLNLANFLSGNLAELIVYRRAITPTERQSVESYLMQKWGIV
jgi:hypothetical protein